MNRRLDSLWFKTSRKYGEKLEKQGFSVYYYDYLTTSEFSAIGKMNNVVGLYLYAHGDKSADEKITGFYTASYKHQNTYYDDILDKEIPGLGHFITPQTKMSNFNPVQIAFLQMCYNQNIWNYKIGKFEYTGGVLPSGEINTFYTVSMGIYEFYRKIMETYYE